MENNHFISSAELQDQLKLKTVMVIDVRSVPEFNEGHIWQAQHFPIEGLPQSISAIPKETFIVTVCNKGGGRSEQASEILRQNGWTSAKWLEGGYMGWVDAGYSDYEAGFSS